MSKKIITLVSASLFLASSVLAEGLIGLKYGTGELEATKNAYTAGATTYAAQTKTEDSDFGAIFLELNAPSVEGLSFGIEYIPYNATVSVDGNSSDSHATLSNHTTLYGLVSRDVGNVSAFLKAGYAHADISNVKANYDSTTINSHDSNMSGPMIGFGLQSEIQSLVGRLEVTYTDYDSIGVTTTSNGSASVKKTADAELMTLSVSIAKAF